MKIPIKYGLLITLGMMAWVLIMHQVVTNPQSIVHTLFGPVFFNVLQFAMIYLGLKALEHEKGDSPRFKEGLKTGVAISFVYALTGSIFFAIVLAIVGTKWMATDPGAADIPRSRLILVAFLALFIGALFLGLIYSTVLAFFTAKRRSEDY
jgi:hypothetical protein